MGFFKKVKKAVKKVVKKTVSANKYLLGGGAVKDIVSKGKDFAQANPEVTTAIVGAATGGAGFGASILAGAKAFGEKSGIFPAATHGAVIDPSPHVTTVRTGPNGEGFAADTGGTVDDEFAPGLPPPIILAGGILIVGILLVSSKK